MRPGRLLAGLVFFLLLGWVGWNALAFLPQAWNRYRDPHSEPIAPGIDTTLFQGDSGVSTDTSSLSQDSSLIGLLDRIGPDLGVARRKTGGIHTSAGDLPLYSLVLHRDQPLPEIVARAIDSLERMGFAILESTESPRGTWPWACRVGREGRPVAILRARIGISASAGAYGMGLVLWADSLSAGELNSLSGLPPGTILALPSQSLFEPRLRDLAARASIHLAFLVRLETSRIPVSRQEDDRLMLHHQGDEIRRRLAMASDPGPLPEGVVVVDGDRGAGDPGLSGRIAKHCLAHDLWLLDASGCGTSRLSSDAMDAGARILGESSHGGTGTIESALESGSLRAERTGEALVVWPLDSTTSTSIRTNLPLMNGRGIEIRTPTPLQRRTGTGD